jgi:DoxX-like protein
MSPKPRMNAQTIVGTVLTYAVAAFFLLDASMQFAPPPPLVEAMRQTGFDPSSGPRLAVVMVICAIALAIPATSVLGAILTTAFLGGAIAVHVRIGEYGGGSQIFCVLLGVAAWAGVYLRNEKLREVLPFTRKAAPATSAGSISSISA